MDAVALPPAETVVTVPMVMLGVKPLLPFDPFEPLEPRGMPKLKVYVEPALDIETVALEPASTVDTPPMDMTGVTPFAPGDPFDPLEPLLPSEPRGMLMSRMKLLFSPDVISAAALLPAGRVLTVPTEIVGDMTVCVPPWLFSNAVSSPVMSDIAWECKTFALSDNADKRPDTSAWLCKWEVGVKADGLLDTCSHVTEPLEEAEPSENVTHSPVHALSCPADGQ
jgi:hypothetical protein